MNIPAINNNLAEFRILPAEFKVHGRLMKLIERNDQEKYAIYTTDDLSSPYFEIFQIRTAKATTIKISGITTHVPARELLPSDNNFGEWAWACSSEIALQKAIDRIKAKNVDEDINS